MTSKSEWQRAHSDLLAEGRRRIEPPTVEEVEALFRGDLSAADAERVRERLAYYPDMAKAMADEQLEADLAAIDEEPETAPAPVPFPKRFSRPAMALAASLLIVLSLGGIYYFKRSQAPARPVATAVLHPDGLKGPSSTRGTRGAPSQTPIRLSTATDYLLKPLFRPDRTYDDYRLELVDLGTSPPQSVWSRDGVRRDRDGSFPVEFSTVTLSPGLYELALYGVEDRRRERLATYTIRFSP